MKPKHSEAKKPKILYWSLIGFPLASLLYFYAFILSIYLYRPALSILSLKGLILIPITSIIFGFLINKAFLSKKTKEWYNKNHSEFKWFLLIIPEAHALFTVWAIPIAILIGMEFNLLFYVLVSLLAIAFSIKAANFVKKTDEKIHFPIDYYALENWCILTSRMLPMLLSILCTVMAWYVLIMVYLYNALL